MYSFFLPAAITEYESHEAMLTRVFLCRTPPGAAMRGIDPTVMSLFPTVEMKLITYHPVQPLLAETVDQSQGAVFAIPSYTFLF